MKYQYFVKYGQYLGLSEEEEAKARKKRQSFYNHAFSLKNWNDYKRKKLFPASHSAKHYEAQKRTEEAFILKCEEEAAEARKEYEKYHIPFVTYNDEAAYSYGGEKLLDKAPAKKISCKKAASAFLEKIDFAALPCDILKAAGDAEKFDAFDLKEAEAQKRKEAAKNRQKYVRGKFKTMRKVYKVARFGTLPPAEKVRLTAKEAFNALHFKAAKDFSAKAEADKLCILTAINSHDTALMNEYKPTIIPSIAARREEIYNVFARLEAEEAAQRSTFTRKARKASQTNETIEKILSENIAERVTYKTFMRLYAGFVDKKTGELKGGKLEALKLAYGYNLPINKEDYIQDLLLYFWEASLSGEVYIMTEEEAAEAEEEAEAGKVVFDVLTASRVIRNKMHSYTKNDRYKKLHSECETEACNVEYIDKNLESLGNDFKGFLYSYFITTAKLAPTEAAKTLRIASACACGYTQSNIALYLGMTRRQIIYRIEKAIKPAILYYCGKYDINMFTIIEKTEKGEKVIKEVRKGTELKDGEKIIGEAAKLVYTKPATIPQKPQKHENYKALMKA